MHKQENLAKLFYSFIASTLVFMMSGAMFGQKTIKPPTAATQADEQEDEGRQIYFDYAGSRQKKPATAKPKSAPRYVRKTAKAKIGAGVKTAAEKSNVLSQVGITLWQLRPSKPTDDKETRIIIQEEVADESKSSPLTPVRIEADTAFISGDKVRLSIESPRSGYLYVIDREQYADGTQSAPFLIFPTLRTRGGNNKVQAGMLIDIPAQEDRPNFFTMKPSRSAQVAEVLTIIVSPQPLDVPPLQRSYLRLPEEQVAKWEREWKTDAERFEMEGGAGQVWTRKEKQAGAGNDGALLDQADPAPQTIYRVNTKPDSPLMITVPLRYQN